MYFLVCVVEVDKERGLWNPLLVLLRYVTGAAATLGEHHFLFRRHSLARHRRSHRPARATKNKIRDQFE